MLKHRKLILSASAQQEIVDEFLTLSRRGIDVQDFDPDATYGGARRSVSEQRGYYGGLVQDRLRALGGRLQSLLEKSHEHEALSWFDDVRRFAEGRGRPEFPTVQILSALPDVFGGIEPDDFRAPNGLRVPSRIQEMQSATEYSALLLLPKLFLSAMAGICGMSPWTDVDLDLGSAVHTVHPDSDKLSQSSAYGAAVLPCHTDGYWNDEMHTPVWNVLLCITNPFLEPTRFVRVADIFRIVLEGHEEYDRWAGIFRDLCSGRSPASFVHSVIEESLKPQFGFVMGQIGGDASRSIHDVPLLEKQRNELGFLFRYKSTFISETDTGRPVVEFVNRMVNYLADDANPNGHHDVALTAGEVLFGLNGGCLDVAPQAPHREGGCEYPVWGPATVHGRKALRVDGGVVKRTFMRGNLIASSEQGSTRGSADAVLPAEGSVRRLLAAGYRANDLRRS